LNRAAAVQVEPWLAAIEEALEETEEKERLAQEHRDHGAAQLAPAAAQLDEEAAAEYIDGYVGRHRSATFSMEI